MGRRRRLLGGLTIGAMAGLLCAQGAGAQPATGEPIKIGAVVSLSGAGAGLGIPERNGMQLAVKTINEQGGVKGRPLKVLIEDDGSKPDAAKSKAEHLIFNEKVALMIGASLTASTDAIAAITHKLQMPQLAFTGLGPPIELTYKALFHVLPPQHLNARAMLEYTTKALKAKKIGVLHDTGYGQVVMNSLQSVSGQYGVEFVAVEKFEVAATDVTTQAAKVRAAQPDVVFVIATSPIPFRNARQVRINQPIVSAIGSATYEYVKGMGEFADDIVFAEFVVGEDPLAHQKKFVELYQKTYNAVPKNFDAAGWDGVHLVARAMEKVGPDAGYEALAKALREPYEGVMASYNFGADDMTGIALTSYVYSKLVKGQFTRVPFRAGK
jgi:branched-chain amino acid transport system substrate-binding protein